MESACKATKRIWDKNKSALKQWGKKVKYDKYIYDRKKSYKNIIDNFDLMNSVFVQKERSFLEEYLSKNEYFIQVGKLFSQFIDRLQENMSLVFTQDEYGDFYKIIYWSKKEISEIIPSVDCCSRTPDTKIFDSSEILDLWIYIDDNITEKYAVVNKIDQNTIEVMIALDSVVKISVNYQGITNESIKVLSLYDMCNNDLWPWRPSQMKLTLFSEDSYDSILSMPIASSIPLLDIHYSSYSIFSSDMLWLLKISEKYPQLRISVNFESHKVNFEKCIYVKVNTKELKFMFKGKQWCFKNCSQNYFKIVWIQSEIRYHQSEGLIVIKAYSIIDCKWELITDSKFENINEDIIKLLKGSAWYDENFYIFTDIESIALDVTYVNKNI